MVNKITILGDTIINNINGQFIILTYNEPKKHLKCCGGLQEETKIIFQKVYAWSM